VIGTHMPIQSQTPWLSIVPIGESRSSYNGLLVFVFIGLSAAIAFYAIHSLASRAVRRGPAWDGGFPDASPATQYTAGSFAQPIRRVFGTTLFRAREIVEMSPPGSVAPSRFHVELRDLAFDLLYTPLAHAVGFVADRVNRFQYLTIRQYLSLVFGALVTLLLVLAVWT
jgi:hydrogenase-4 component B